MNNINSSSLTTTAPIIIDQVEIKQNENGLYCLNDIHKVYGRNKPRKHSQWIDRRLTQVLINVIERETKTPRDKVISGQRGANKTGAGTYACLELVLDYASWVSTSFGIKIKKAFEKVNKPVVVQPVVQPEPPKTPSTELSTFNHALFGKVRVVNKGGEPWFIAKDVADALGYSLPSAMTRYLDEDEKGMSIKHTLGGPQELQAINESGLYSAILRSRRPEAKMFKKWITSEVLPTIRKTGSYSLHRETQTHQLPDFTNPSEAARAWANEYDGRLVAEQKVTALEPKAAFAEEYLEADHNVALRYAAQELNKQNEMVYQSTRT
ncbi:BRO family protein [Spartinivicinus marinus]|nr:BRO family protein [Spartinivicinus marinus]MCX4026429.1 BRO family protein [Spartinivicinus marinus]